MLQHGDAKRLKRDAPLRRPRQANERENEGKLGQPRGCGVHMLVLSLLACTRVDGYARTHGVECVNRFWSEVYHPELYANYTTGRCAQYCNSAHACVGFAWRPNDCRLFTACDAFVASDMSYFAKSSLVGGSTSGSTSRIRAAVRRSDRRPA